MEFEGDGFGNCIGGLVWLYDPAESLQTCTYFPSQCSWVLVAVVDRWRSYNIFVQTLKRNACTENVLQLTN